MIGKFRSFLAKRHNVRAHFWQSLANYTQNIGGLALGVVLARILSPSDFGQFAYAQALVFLAQQVASWNLSQALLATRCRDEHLVREAWHLETWVFTLKALIALAVAGFFLARGSHMLALLTLLCGLPPAINGFTNLLRAECDSSGHFKPHFLSSILTILLAAGIGIPLALMGFGPIAIAAPGIPLLILQPLLYRALTPLALPHPIAWRRISLKPLHSGFSLWLCASSEQAIFRLDKILLGKFTTPEALGNYNRAYGYSPLSHFALSSLYTNPTIAALGRKTNWPEKKSLILKHLAILIPAGLANALFWIFFSDPVVPFLFGPQWTPAIPVFQAMSTLSLCMAAYYLPAAYLFHCGDFLALGLLRFTLVVVLGLSGLLLAHQLTPTTMAIILQACLLATGTLLFIRCAQLVGRQK